MTGTGAQGKWMVSTVKEKDITKLREAGYLAKEVCPPAPDQGTNRPYPEVP